MNFKIVIIFIVSFIVSFIFFHYFFLSETNKKYESFDGTVDDVIYSGKENHDWISLVSDERISNYKKNIIDRDQYLLLKTLDPENTDNQLYSRVPTPTKDHVTCPNSNACNKFCQDKILRNKKCSSTCLSQLIDITPPIEFKRYDIREKKRQCMLPPNTILKNNNLHTFSRVCPSNQNIPTI